MAIQTITKVGAFTNDVVDQLNANFAELDAGGSGETFASPTITGTVAGGASYTAPTITSPTITGTTTIGAGATLTSPTLVTPALGTPASGVATNLTGTAAGLTAGVASAVAVGGVTGLGTGVATALAIANGASGGYAVNAVGGVAAAYKLARVTQALGGSNPTSWATGLTTIVAAGATLNGTAAPGVGTSVLTSNINGTSLDIYAWKPTAAGDCTLIASTGTESISAWAVGT